ncbi:S9 family peptidase [Paenibacillus sp. R14(2021)]|uniref:alpha/beta hydrolase family protein n=1 Tax=Paenibacillus sp. R14(2021) TaxID=2859228 RepID=UPI001C615C21|nr:alpha/beta fold hydrolase [Paenibacillus sp. R14(2021)]
MSSSESCHRAGIPCHVLAPRGESKGTVLLYHGWGSAIDHYLFFGAMIADWGYDVIVPELPEHGVRGKLDYGDTIVLERYFWQVVLKGAEEAAAITAELNEAAGTIAVIGHSAGGFIAAGAMIRSNRIQAGIVINGSCAWAKFEELYREKTGRRPMDAGEQAFLAKHDPYTRLALEDERALLMLHGTEDTTVPIDSQRYVVQTKPHLPLSRLQLVEYAGVNHHITLGMLEKANNWLQDTIVSKQTGSR